MAVVPTLSKHIYHLGYDLCDPGKDYEPLWAFLHRIGVRALASEWLVETTMTRVQLAEAIARLMDANDRLLITLLPGNNWACKNLLPGAYEWLAARRP